MKVLKYVAYKIDRTYRVTCWRCTSELEYTEEDIKHNPKNEEYVECPVCKAFT